MLIGYASTRPHHGPPSDAQRFGLLARGCSPCSMMTRGQARRPAGPDRRALRLRMVCAWICRG